MSHLSPLIADLGLILSVAAVTTIISKMVRQPVVLGYIVAGFFVGPHVAFIPTVIDEGDIRTWSDIGVIFLLFSLGLEFSFRKLVKVGGTAAVTALVTVLFMLGAGFVTGLAMGWSTMDSLFLGGILSISSTTIIFRALDELGLKTASFASLVLGVLVVEDLVAILLLVLLSTLAVSQHFSGGALLFEMGKLGFFLVLWFTVGVFIIPSLLTRLRKWMNDETLLILSVALCLSMVYVAVQAGFSAPLGAFVMGSLLAETSKAERIEHLIKPVKDLFAAIFFVSVGMMIDPHVLREHWLPVLIVCLVTLIGQPLSSALGALLAGQPLRIAVRAGMSLSQIGEFSFIIATLGLTLGVTSELLYPVAVAVSAITTFTTPYMIKAGSSAYGFIARVLPRRWQDGLARYSDQTGQVKALSDWRKLLRAYLLNIGVHGVIAVAVVLLCGRFVTPLFMDDTTGPAGTGTDGGHILAGLLTLLAILPFIWAMAIRRIQREAYRHLWLARRTLRGPLVAIELLRVLAALLVLALVVALFFPTGWAFWAVPLFVITAVLVFRQRLQRFHQRIEDRFLFNLNRNNEKEDQRSSDLAPWDMHLASVPVPEGSHVGGRSLEELALREKHGINIAFIERDGRSIAVPGRDERLLPGDDLLVIGTDEQLAQLQASLAVPSSAGSESGGSEEDVKLLRFKVRPGSPLVGVSIRSSGLREGAQALVVGIERGGERLLNPDGELPFQEGDLLWIVGDGARIKAFMGDGKGIPA